ERLDGRGGVLERRDSPEQGACVVVGDGVDDERPHRLGLLQRVQPAPTDELAHLALEDRDTVHVTPCILACPAGTRTLWVKSPGPPRRRPACGQAARACTAAAPRSRYPQAS